MGSRGGTQLSEPAFLHAYRSQLGALVAQADATERAQGIQPIRLVIRPQAGAAIA